MPTQDNEVKVPPHGGPLVDDLPVFPFGFYCLFPAEGLVEEEIHHGFNMMMPYMPKETSEREALLPEVLKLFDRCAELGMKVHFSVGAVAGMPDCVEKWEIFEREVGALKEHPALLAWYLADEPELGGGMSPALLDSSYRFIKEIDPCHPITICFCAPNHAVKYRAAFDILMQDPYPIPFNPVTDVSEVSDYIARTYPDTPFWIVPQAFGGGEAWSREPTAREERVMTYLAVIHGATGIQYFVRRPPIGNPMSPSLWSECRRLGLEFSEMGPALLSGEPKPEVTCDADGIHVAAWDYRGAKLVLAANTLNAPCNARFSLQDDGDSCRELFEIRNVEIADGQWEDPIEAFGTKAYFVGEPESVSCLAPLSEGNLTHNPSFEEMANPGTPDGVYCFQDFPEDGGASALVDPRLAFHGRHSLRLTTPRDGQGITLRPFPVPIGAGTRYRVSVWAVSDRPDAKLEMGMESIGSQPQQFAVGGAWAECAMEGEATKEEKAQITIQPLTAGRVWLDLLQCHPA